VRLVYYSLAREYNSEYDKQWAQSVRSLRARNWHIPVTTFIFNGASDFIRSEAERCQVQLIQLGSYRDWLQKYHPHGWVLAFYPTLHKFLVLSEADTTGLSQALYVDCDTFFFEDPEILFDSLGPYHWCARESPTSRLCPHGYDPNNVNEDLIQQIVSVERLNWVAPFNAGVCLLNNGIWATFRQLRDIFFDTVWRLMVGRHCLGASGSDDRHIGEAVLSAASPCDVLRALPYPSRNFWILEEIALWITLGHVQNFAQSFLDSERVMQGLETIDAVRQGRLPALAHYFSCFQNEFFQHVQALR
jgi:hypothetical protein